MLDGAGGKADPLPLVKRVARLWSAPGFPSHWAVRALYRGWLISFPIGFVLIPLSLIAFGCLAFGHPWLPAGVVFVFIAFGLAPAIFRQALRVLLAIQSGLWTRKGVPVRREEQARRYWSWTAVEGLGLAIQLAASSYLLFVGATMS